SVAELREEHDLFLVLMHRQGGPGTMQASPMYGDALAEVQGCLRERMGAAVQAGIPADRLALDPGIGFGKRLEHNLQLLRGLGELRALGAPLLLGVSRKSFIGHITGEERAADWKEASRRRAPALRERIGGTAATIALAVSKGSVDILRVHDVAIMREAALVAAAIGPCG
ncbi:MAG: dihydropteroate synthase, partial [Planctomycetota bacterium]